MNVLAGLWVGKHFCCCYMTLQKVLTNYFEVIPKDNIASGQAEPKQLRFPLRSPPLLRAPLMINLQRDPAPVDPVAIPGDFPHLWISGGQSARILRSSRHVSVAGRGQRPKCYSTPDSLMLVHCVQPLQWSAVTICSRPERCLASRTILVRCRRSHGPAGSTFQSKL